MGLCLQCSVWGEHEVGLINTPHLKEVLFNVAHCNIVAIAAWFSTSIFNYVHSLLALMHNRLHNQIYSRKSSHDNSQPAFDAFCSATKAHSILHMGSKFHSAAVEPFLPCKSELTSDCPKDPQDTTAAHNLLWL